MKHEYLMEMSKDELDNYGKALGLDLTKKTTVAKKVAEIEEKRERIADVEVLGMTVHIPMKRMHDKRVSDTLAHTPISDEDANTLLALLLGEDQMEQLVERVTDDDGTVDVDAMGLAIVNILSSDELKNL